MPPFDLNTVLNGTAASGAAAAAEGGNPLRQSDDHRLQRVAGPSILVIFGVTGDLARKKLLPAVYDLANRGLLPPGFALVGFARPEVPGGDFDRLAHDAVREHARTGFREDTWSGLAQGIRFVPGEFDDPDAFQRLRATIEQLDAERGTLGNRAYYLSIPPRFFGLVADQLQKAGLAGRDAAAHRGWRRVVVEKPFGSDLATARALNQVLATAFEQDAVFRIDHYLGKETVQNILALRFANDVFQPIWNRDSIDHVQITMAEDIGVAGRAGYYDGIGAARDVIQNHLLQLLALTAMEEPLSLSAADLRAEKEKVLAAVRLPSDLAAGTVRGQYAAGWQGGERVRGFLDESGVHPGSRTETFAALRLEVATRRWDGVPFYLRTGKRLGRRVTEIALVLKRGWRQLFATPDEERAPNALVIRVQPDEGITIRFAAKVPGTATRIRDVTMDFGYGHAFTESSPEAYERLILDVLLGDAPLFPRHQEVELSWRILDPVTAFWSAQPGPVDRYEPGSWGPDSADALLAREGRVWRRP